MGGRFCWPAFHTFCLFSRQRWSDRLWRPPPHAWKWRLRKLVFSRNDPSDRRDRIPLVTLCSTNLTILPQPVAADFLCSVRGLGPPRNVLDSRLSSLPSTTSLKILTLVNTHRNFTDSLQHEDP